MIYDWIWSSKVSRSTSPTSSVSIKRACKVMVLSMQGNCSKCSGRPDFSRQTTVSGEAMKDSHRPETSFITSVASLDYMMADILGKNVYIVSKSQSKSTLFKVIFQILICCYLNPSHCAFAPFSSSEREPEMLNMLGHSVLMKGTGFSDVKT